MDLKYTNGSVYFTGCDTLYKALSENNSNLDDDFETIKSILKVLEPRIDNTEICEQACSVISKITDGKGKLIK